MSKIKQDLEELLELALKEGASRAKVINTNLVAVDERVRFKCMYPPCVNYGRNLMCPPFTPTPKEFREVLKKYKYAIIFQIDKNLDKEIQEYIKKDGITLTDLSNNEKFIELASRKSMAGGADANKIIAAIEREAFKKGYHFATGLTAGPCLLCEECDTKKPCKHPWEARPGMGAVGIHVSKTAENAGFKIQWGTKESMNLTALVLID